MSDYTPVVIGSKTRAGGAKPRELATTGEVDRKVGAGNKASVDPDHRKIAALDRNDEPAPPKTISPDVGKAMQTARQELGMKQSDLATKVNEKPTVISDYEAGRAIPNPQLLAKLEKALKVKLRGKDIGSPLLSISEKKALEKEQAGKKK